MAHIGNINDLKSELKEEHIEPLLCDRCREGCSMCTVHSCTVKTYMGAAFLLCDTLSAHLLSPGISDSSSERKDARGFCTVNSEAEFSRGRQLAPPIWKATKLFKPHSSEKGVALVMRIHFCFQSRETTNAEIKVF